MNKLEWKPCGWAARASTLDFQLIGVMVQGDSVTGPWRVEEYVRVNRGPYTFNLVGLADHELQAKKIGERHFKLQVLNFAINALRQSMLMQERQPPTHIHSELLRRRDIWENNKKIADEAQKRVFG